MIRSVIVASSIVFCATSSIAAQSVTYQPQPALQPQAVTVPNRSIDILGIQIGMDFNSAKSSAEKALPGLKFSSSKSKFGYDHRGLIVQTPEFISGARLQPANMLAHHKMIESVSMAFSGPASGNQLVSAARLTTYNDVVQAPSVETMKKALVERYGPPSHSKDGGGDSILTWTFINDEQRNCPPTAECALPSGEYSLSNLGNIAKSPSQVGLALYVKLTNSASDLSKVSQAHFYLSSATKQKQTAKADIDSLKGAAEQAWTKASQNVTAPKL